MKLTRLFVICAGVAIAAACSSGGSSVAPRPASSAGAGQGSMPALNQTITFTVDIPPAPSPAPTGNALHKRADGSSVYLSPNTGSIGIRLVAVNDVSLAQPPPAQPPTNVPATCRGSATGCHVTIPGVVAAIGVDTYTVTTFAGADGEGAVVSTGIIAVTVGGSGTVGTIGGDPTELALGGYVASLSVTVTPSHFVFGVPGTASVVISPKDAAGATIVGNAQFAFPIVLSVTGSGFRLSGPGLAPDGTIVLLEPQAPTPPILLAFDGTGDGATVNASSQNGSGVTVTAPPVLIGVPTPSPLPTSSSISTLPPLSPTPTSSGSSIPTATPSSMYELGGYDNSIFEFSEPVKGNYSESPRRGFGGSSLDCNQGYALLGIATDPSANVYVGAPEGLFGSCSLHFYSFPPNFTGPGAPAPLTIDAPGSSNEQDLVFQFAFDPPNGGKLDFADDSVSPLGTSTFFVGRVPTGGGAANPTLGYPVKKSAIEGCFVSSGLPNPDPTCGNGSLGNSSFFDEYNNYDLNAPFAVGPDGSLYIAVFDEYVGPGNPNFGQGQPAIVRVTPPNQISAGTITAEAAWIEGPGTLMSFPVALAFDATKNSLWVYDAGQTISNSSPSTPPPIAGPGAYLLEFPLSAFAGSGAQNVAPAAFLSGQTDGRFATANANLLAIQPNAIAVGDGNVFVANQVGPYDGVVATPPPPPYNGEVDVYSDAVTGVNPNTVAPIAIFYGSTVRGPIAVGFGPHGSALGSGNLLHVPRNLPQLRAQFIARQRRAILSARARAQIRAATSRRR